ncbi:predicted protein [Botrytis cinerea T4]|uniref:Uncharacterized protein n=1 Tax=Botryotinia fuckeliana (strain T4) TaxID=999810 RepID=G2Y254_BOTF4|nr:predicted protein [Botrytis cinerea T4]
MSDHMVPAYLLQFQQGSSIDISFSAHSEASHVMSSCANDTLDSFTDYSLLILVVGTPYEVLTRSDFIHLLLASEANSSIDIR